PISAARRALPAARRGALAFFGASRRLQHSGSHDELLDDVEAVALLYIGEHPRSLATHLQRVALHDVERGAHHWREIDLVDDQQIRARDSRAAFARNLVSGR